MQQLEFKEAENCTENRQQVVVKVACLGDISCGFKSLFAKHITSKYDDCGIELNGMEFWEMKVSLKNMDVTFTMWELSRNDLFKFAVADAQCIIFGFDLNDINSLRNIKQLYKQSHKHNKNFESILIGRKYNIFNTTINEKNKKIMYQESKKYAMKMNSSLIYVSQKFNINVNKAFKMLLTKTFNLVPSLKEIHKGALFIWDVFTYLDNDNDTDENGNTNLGTIEQLTLNNNNNNNDGLLLSSFDDLDSK